MRHWSRRPRSVAQRGNGPICLVLTSFLCVHFYLFRGMENEHDTAKKEDEDKGVFFFLPVLCQGAARQRRGWGGMKMYR